MVFKEHGIVIYLDKTLLVGFNKLMGDKELGRSYAGLLCFTEGLYRHGYISEQQYRNHKKRYSVPLTKDPQQVTLEEHESALHMKQLNKQFADVINQWHLHEDPHWRNYWIEQAKEHGDVPNAKKLLAFVEEQKIKVG